MNLKRLLVAVVSIALALSAVCLYQPPAQAQSTNALNLPTTILASAARTTTPINSADQTNVNYRGIAVVINVSAFTAGTYTFSIQGKDSISGNYYNMLTSAAIGATGVTVLRIYPGMSSVANVANGDFLPRVWRIQAVGASGQSMTFSVSGVLAQ